MFELMGILPQGALSEGCWTLLSPGVPLTPRAGVMTQSAVTEDVKARSMEAVMKGLEKGLHAARRPDDVLLVRHVVRRWGVRTPLW